LQDFRLTANVEEKVFHILIPCSLVQNYKYFGGLLKFDQTIWHHIAKDLNLP